MRLSSTYNGQTIYSNILTLSPTLNLISVTDLGSSNFEVSFSSNFNLPEVFSQVRLNDSHPWSNPLLFSSSVSPQQIAVSFGSGPFEMRLYSPYNAQTIYSNILMVQ